MSLSLMNENSDLQRPCSKNRTNSIEKNRQLIGNLQQNIAKMPNKSLF